MVVYVLGETICFMFITIISHIKSLIKLPIMILICMEISLSAKKHDASVSCFKYDMVLYVLGETIQNKL